MVHTFFLSTYNTFKIVLASSLCMWGLLLHVANYYLITFVVGRGATYILALIVFLGEARTPHCFIWVRAWKPRRWPDSTTSCSTLHSRHISWHHFPCYLPLLLLMVLLFFIEYSVSKKNDLKPLVTKKILYFGTDIKKTVGWILSNFFSTQKTPSSQYMHLYVHLVLSLLSF